jgi:hypothetical protein
MGYDGHHFFKLQEVRVFTNTNCHSERSEESRDPSLSLRVTNKHSQEVEVAFEAGQG